MPNSPHPFSRLAPHANPTAGPSLTERLLEALRRARPDVRLLGVRLPQDVTDTSRGDRPLLARPFERAIEQLIADPRVATDRLCALGHAIIAHVRTRRNDAPELATAMRREQQTNAALDLTQWCTGGALTPMDVREIRDRAAAQRDASEDLMCAADAWLARDAQRATRVA